MSSLARFISLYAFKSGGIPAGGMITNAMENVQKKIYGGIPVDCQLYITDTYIEFKPNLLIRLFTDNIASIKIPKSEIIDIKKSSFSITLQSHTVKLILKSNKEFIFFVQFFPPKVKKIIQQIKE
jgi:hypothetical protein